MYQKKPPPVAASQPDWTWPPDQEKPTTGNTPDLETGVDNREVFKDNSFKESRRVRYSSAFKDA